MSDDWKKEISLNPNRYHGQACIKGTRVLISVILDCLAEGMTEEEILSEYPSLKRGDILIAIKYAASLAREEIFIQKKLKSDNL